MDRSQMASQLARLLATSDLEELVEAIARWKALAASDAERRTMDEMGDRLLDVKRALAGAPKQPSAEELEEMLRVMLLLASDPEAVKPPR
jgi:alcohol dehydrogenase class IV